MVKHCIHNQVTPLYLRTLQNLYLTRFADEKMSKLSRQNKGGAFHLSSAGHELVGTLGALHLTPGKDWGLPYYRDRAFALGLGCPLRDLIGAFLARAVSHHSGGRMMPEHFSHRSLRIPCQSSCVGSQFLQAVGVAKGLQFKGGDEVVYVSAGEGATSQGDFHEALNFASLHRLGIIFVIQDNGWAISVSVAEQTAGGSIASVARGHHGLSVFDVDGLNFTELSQAFSEAVQKGREREGPSLVLAKIPRLGPHSSSDDPLKYKTLDLIEAEKQRDPLSFYEKWLLDQNWISQEEIDLLRQEAFELVEKAAREAEEIPFPDSTTATSGVFKEIPEWTQQEKEGTGEAIVMMDALNHALDEEMARDPNMVIFGQDVAHGKGGVFGITRRLTEKYGKERCFNSPLAESTIIGLALGMSLVDHIKPVVEIQFADYLWTGINQLFNELASFYYRSNGEWNCPVVIRMPYGGYIQGGPYHSQSIEAFLAHCPGLKIAIPSHAADAKRLLKMAIRDPNPVIVLEHKALYRQRVFCARPETGEEELLPFGKAAIVREGKDATIVVWGILVPMAVEIADRLKEEEIHLEIIDLRTINPWDKEAVLHSVQKTGKLLIAHEAAKTAGFGAEIAASLAEAAFSYLDAPIQRLCGADCPVPYSKGLEEQVLPQSHTLEKAIRDLIAF
jgi:2-oxoisovalerate dehydrogenase E1 component